MVLSKNDPSDSSKSEIFCTFTNSSGSDFSNFSFQTAVPKFIELSMRPPSGNSISKAGGTLTQVLNVKNAQLGTKTLMVSPPSVSNRSLRRLVPFFIKKFV